MSLNSEIYTLLYSFHYSACFWKVTPVFLNQKLDESGLFWVSLSAVLCVCAYLLIGLELQMVLPLCGVCGREDQMSKCCFLSPEEQISVCVHAVFNIFLKAPAS